MSKNHQKSYDEVNTYYKETFVKRHLQAPMDQSSFILGYSLADEKYNLTNPKQLFSVLWKKGIILDRGVACNDEFFRDEHDMPTFESIDLLSQFDISA